MDKNKIRENSQFSAQRFKMLMKSDFAINKSHYLKYAICFIGVFLMFSVISSVTYYAMGKTFMSIPSIPEMETDVVSFSNVQNCNIIYLLFSLWTICIGLTIFGSLTFSSMGSQKGRIAILMQPASMLEKFILRFLIYFIGGLITLAFGFFLGLLVCQLAYNGGEQIFKIIKFFFFTSDGAWPFTIVMVLCTFLLDGIYTVGSSLWPKLSWIKTWVIVVAIQWVLGSLLISGMMSNLNLPALAIKLENYLEIIWWISISVLVILNFSCWLIAWWRFRTTQIVQRFMSK